MNEFLLILLLLWALLQQWKVINLAKSRTSMFTWMQQADQTLVRVLRAVSANKNLATAYSNTICNRCKELLPEGTIKQHDGRWLCSTCKVDEAVEKDSAEGTL